MPSLRDLVFDPEKLSMCKIVLTDHDGKNKHSFRFKLGDEQLYFIGDNKQECIKINILEGHTADLQNFFYYLNNLETKIDCTSVESKVFFELFDIILPQIGVKKFKLEDASFKQIGVCLWYFRSIQYFLTGKTFYEKHGFKTIYDPGAESLQDVRENAMLNEIKWTTKLLSNLKIILGSEDVSQIKLFDFLNNILKPLCIASEHGDETKQSESRKLLGPIIRAIDVFIREKLELSNESFKEYSDENDNIVPAKIKVTKSNDNENDYEIFITKTLLTRGGKNPKKFKRTKRRKMVRSIRKKTFFRKRRVMKTHRL